jgi:P pilus assembly chaperone PapD
MRPAGTLATSCAAWVNIKENDNYFSLRPGEKKELKVTLTPPADFPDSLPVHTAMLFVTQMNPTESEDVAGANLKVSVRSGIKIFHRTPNPPVKKIEILHMGFNKEAQHIDLQFENRSNVWTDGIVYADLMHTGTGKKTTLPHIVYYSLPGNTRDLAISLPAGLAPGKYIASVLIDYGIEDAVEVAELTFTHE